MSQKAYLRSLLFAALLGIPVAFAAVLFQTALHDLIELVWHDIPDGFDWDEPPVWYVLLVPGLAGLLVAAVLRLPGHGGHTPLEGLGLVAIKPIELVSILPAALISLSFGIVLGPEAPLLALGFAIGVVGVRMAGMADDEGRLLVLAGAFAAVAGLFGGPLPAAFLLFEALAMSGRMQAQDIGRALLPGFVAAGSGALVYTGVADWPGLDAPELSLPLPDYPSVRLVDLAWCVLVSVVAAVVVVAFRDAAVVLSKRVLTARPVVVLVSTGVAIGALAVVFRALADRPVDLVLFSGQVVAAHDPGRGLGRRARAARAREGLRLHALAGRGLPGWACLPRDHHRDRARRARAHRASGPRSRAGGCCGDRSLHRGRVADAVLCSGHGGAPRRTGGRRRRAHCDSRRRRRLDRRDRSREGLSLYVERVGSGPPVLLVHGSVTGARLTWREQLPLADRWTLLLVDRPGFGESPALARSDFEAEAPLLADLLDDPAHVVAHSYGGVIALLAAAMRPAGVRSLTVVEPPAFGVARGQPAVERFVARATELWTDPPEDPAVFLERFFRLVGSRPVLGRLKPELERGTRLLMSERYPWEARIPLDDLAAAPFPKLAVSGAHDDAFEAVCDVLADRIGAEREVLPGRGHGAQRTGAPFNERLELFLASAESG